MIRFLAALAMLFSVAAGAAAAESGTPDEARSMAIRAADLLRAKGPALAFAAFNDKTGAFHDRDLYVFVYDSSGHAVAHGLNPALIGKDMTGLKDVDGKEFVRAFIAVTDTGWIEYKWLNPATRTVDPKTSYVIRVGEYLVGVGAYRH